MSPYHLALAISLASALSGCDLANILEGKKSEFQIETERRQALSMPVIPASVTPVIEAVADVPVVQVPECTGDTFRVSRCSEGKIMPWEY